MGQARIHHNKEDMILVALLFYLHPSLLFLCCRIPIENFLLDRRNAGHVGDLHVQIVVSHLLGLVSDYGPEKLSIDAIRYKHRVEEVPE